MTSSSSSATVCAQVLSNPPPATHYNHLRYLILEILASTYNVDKPKLHNALSQCPQDEASPLPEALQPHLDDLSSLVADTRRQQNLQDYAAVAPQTWTCLYTLIIKPSYKIDDAMSNLLDLFEHYARNRHGLARRYRPTPFSWHAPCTWFGRLDRRVVAKRLVSDAHVVLCMAPHDGVRDLLWEAIDGAGWVHLRDWHVSRTLYSGFYTTDLARDLWCDVERVAGRRRGVEIARADARRRGLEIVRRGGGDMELE